MSDKSKRFFSIILSVLMLLQIGVFSVFAENSNTLYTAGTENNALTSAIVNGYHHFPNIAYGGSSFAAINAAESSGSFEFRTDCSVKDRMMSDSDAPTATYYVDVSRQSTVSVPLQFTLLDKTYCDVMNYSMQVFEPGYSLDCSGQQFVSDKSVGYSETHYITGPAPKYAGQTVDFLVSMWTDIAQNKTFSETTFIHALSIIKIRLVGCGEASVQGLTKVSNRCTRNYPYVYTTDRTLSVYNVNSGTDSCFENLSDGAVSIGDSYFHEYPSAYAYAYIDSTKYTDLSQTPIEFVHHVQALCGAGGWSWTDVLVSSDYSTYSATRNLHYTVPNGDFVSPVYTLPFKLHGKVPAAGETAIIKVTSRCNSLGHNSPEQIFYNSDASIILTVYGIDKTQLKAAIDTPVGENHPAENYSAYINALNNATAVYNNPTVSQEEIINATDILCDAISNIDKLPENKLILKSESNLKISNKLLLGDFSDIAYINDEFENDEIFIYSHNGNQVENPSLLTTGMRIAVKTDGRITDYADIVIPGDVSCDGRLDGQDAVLVRSILSFGNDRFSEYCIKAADLNTDGRISKYDADRLEELGVFIGGSPTGFTPEFIGINDVVVSLNGNDSNDGTYQYPLNSITAAKEKVKQIRKSTSEPLTVWIHGGTYFFDSALTFNSQDADNVTYKAIPNEKVELSGSDSVSGFSETTVNGVRAFVTSYSYNGDTDGFNALYNGNVRLQRPTWPQYGEFNVKNVAPEDAISPDDPYFALNRAFYANQNDLLNFRNARDVDVRIMHWWKDELLPINTLDTSTGRVSFQKASSMTINPNDRYIFENVFEALNSPGEWYYDRTEQKIYYIPFAGETTENTVLTLGKTNQLITVDNCSGIAFEGITFRDTDWRMQSGEHSNALIDGLNYYSDMSQACYDIPCAVQVKHSKNITFKSCDFRNIGASGLMFGDGTDKCSVSSTRFKDIGGNPVYIRGVNDPNSSSKTHDITVNDCLIETYGRVFNNAVGILLIHAYNCNLNHNEIHDGFYTGISCGWTWGYGYNISDNNHITNNLIYDIGQGWLSDMGGIYTLGMQPETVIRNNVIYNVGCSKDESGYGGWGIYLDEGSSGIDVSQNLVYNCSSDGFHQHYGKYNDVYNNIFALNGEAQMKLTRVEPHTSINFTNNILLADNTSMYANCETNSFADNNNLYWDLTRKDNIYSGSLDKSKVIKRGFYNNAVIADPQFADPYSFDFTFKNEDTIRRINFVTWDYSKAGTQTDFSKLYAGSNDNGASITLTCRHNFNNIAAGGFRFSIAGADEVSYAERSFNIDSLNVTREMSDSDAPIATFYVDTKKTDSVKIKLGFEVENIDYADCMNYHYITGDYRYKTSAANQVFVDNYPVGTKRTDYLTGPSPSKAGDVVELTVTLITDMARHSTYSPTSFINSNTKIKVRLVGV